jgi:protein-disulfide isomerase
MCEGMIISLPRLAAKVATWIAAPAAALALSVTIAHAAPLSPDQQNQVRAIVRDYLVSHPEVLEEAQVALEAKRAAATRARLAPKLERDPRRFSVGPANAPITVVEFFDYRCPYCHAAYNWVEANMRARKDVRWVFVEFPILGPNSLETSRAAVATMKQGKYLAFHRAVYKSQSALNSKDIDGIAKSVGVDVPRMRRDMNDPAIMALLQADHDIAAQEKVDSTPTFLINGTWFNGFQPDQMDKTLRALSVRKQAAK